MVSHVFRAFFVMSWHLRNVYLVQLVLMLLGAGTIAAVEKIPIGDAVYFAFVTALTIGYGDIVAHSVAGRVVSILLGVVGILFTGLVVSVAVHAVRDAWEQTQHPD
jgi:voltage-gated potassium channel